MWKDIIGFEGLYQIDEYGNVKSLERMKQNNNGLQKVNERILKIQHDNDGYSQVMMSKNGKHYLKKIHRLVAEAFIPNPDNLPVINHKDENVRNNYYENLEWCTIRYNTNYGNGIRKMAESQGYKVAQLLNDRIINTYYSMNEASRRTNIPQSNIWKVCHGERNTAGGFQWKIMEEHL